MNPHLKSMHQALLAGMPKRERPPVKPAPNMAVKFTRTPVGSPPPKGIVRPSPKKRKAKPVAEDPPGHWNGHPFAAWIGRCVKSFGDSTASGKCQKRTVHGHACKVVGFGDGTITLRPNGHGYDETIPIGFVRPWWAKNPDLKPKSTLSGGESAIPLNSEILSKSATSELIVTHRNVTNGNVRQAL
jgi:hypothetical protein